MNHIHMVTHNAEENLQLQVAEMRADLQHILKHERKHFNFYLQASMELRGLERLYLKPLLEKEMASELEHIRQFGEKIVALGGEPSHEAYAFHLGHNLGEVPRCHHVLREAIRMEREILAIYHDLYSKAEKFAEVFKDMSIALMLEENIEHTTADVEEMERMVVA